jgi:hypothetical protein
MSHKTDNCPEEPRGRSALLARMTPLVKFTELVIGAGTPAGKHRRSPAADGRKTARLMATAFAADGIPHRPATGKVLVVPAASAGPPEGPTGLRVSITRQGLTV